MGGAIFRKAMRLSPSGRHDVGNVVNLMSVDARTVFNFIPEVGVAHIPSFYFVIEGGGVV